MLIHKMKRLTPSKGYHDRYADLCAPVEIDGLTPLADGKKDPAVVVPDYTED